MLGSSRAMKIADDEAKVLVNGEGRTTALGG